MNINEYISSGVIELCVLGLATTDEKQELALLRRQHPEVDAAVTRFEQELETGMQKNVTLPSAETDKKILEKLATLQAPALSEKIVLNNRVVPFNWLKAVAAAAVLLLFVSLFLNLSLYQKSKTNNQVLQTTRKAATTPTLPASDFDVLTNPRITPVAMYGVGTHAICRCTMFWDKETGKIYIMIHHLPASSDSEDFQLWAFVNGKPINVGMVNEKIRDRFIELQGVPIDATEFTVTLEDAGNNTDITLENAYLHGEI